MAQLFRQAQKILKMVEKYELHLVLKFFWQNDRIAENLSQAPGTGLYLNVHHDSPSSEITLL
jgi:hypothetical protein